MAILKFIDPFHFINGQDRHYGKGGGGGVDTSGLEQAKKEAIALQKQMYEQGREDFQPWYQAGAGSIGKLADLLGVTGGSVRNREDIYNELLPQYKTQESSGMDGMYVSPSGQLVTLEGAIKDYKSNSPLSEKYLRGYDDSIKQNPTKFGYNPYSTTQESTDYEALNAAVEEQLAQQGETPEGYGSLLQKFGMEQFQEDPGAQFRQDEANKALERQMAAQGVTLGGAGFGDINPSAARNLSELNQNLASQEYNNAYNRYTQDQLNTFNMLMGVSGQGAGVTGQQVQAGNQYGENVGNLTTGLASAQLNAQMAQNAQKSSMFNSMLGTIGTIGLGAATGGFGLGAAGAGASGGLNASAMASSAMPNFFLSDRTMKTNITEAGTKNGHKLYEFNYIGDDKRYKGVMAQDLLSYIPEAVQDIGGVLHVNYDMLGVEMETV